MNTLQGEQHGLRLVDGGWCAGTEWKSGQQNEQEAKK